MRPILIFLFLFFSKIAAGQADSAVYFHYKQDTDVVRVNYIVKYHANNQPKEEGWVVTYVNAANSKIYKVEGAPADREYEIKVGTWKGYYKNGALQYTDSAYIATDSAGNTYSEFNKEGVLLAKYIYSNMKTIPDKNTATLFKPGYENTASSPGEKRTEIYYYSSGKIKEIRHYCQNKSCGTDQYFDEQGKLTKEITH
jgi:antitoxin component YwqK of YwqJK toxin-antitoxin module